MYNAHTGPLFKQLRIPKLVDIYTIPNFVNLCIYSPAEHFPVLCRWSSRVIQMCIRTRLELPTIHILLREKIPSSQNSLCTKHQ